MVRSQVDHTLKGYNSTAIAYGITGSGKTHTIFGDIYSESKNGEKGVIIHSVEYLFDKINVMKSENSSNNSTNYIIKISYLEIYNENVIDLLTDNFLPLLIVEDLRGVVVPDLTEYKVEDPSQIYELIKIGNTRRMMAATGQNQFSSRSHALLQIIVEQKTKLKDNKEEITYSKFTLVDLAGSERGGLERGIRSHEGSNINKSLLALGTCINILSDKSKSGSFIPYRNSKLTRLLKDSLGGNILTVFIACIGPSPTSYDETLSCLKYAAKTRKIQKKVTKNIRQEDTHLTQYKDIIDSLKTEIDQLKGIIKTQNNTTKSNLDTSHIRKKKDNTFLNTNNDFWNNDDGESPILSSFSVINKNKSNKPQSSYSLEEYQKYYDLLQDDFTKLNLEETENILEKLKLEKFYYEDLINEKKDNLDETTKEKILFINEIYDDFLKLFNVRLVSNLEQNMLINYNLKEISELNQNNSNNLEILKTKLHNINEIQTNNDEDIITYENNDDINKEVMITKEEIVNIQKNIEENNKLIEQINHSLEINIESNKVIKKIFIKLISNSKKLEGITDFQQAYKILESEKKELADKNLKYQEYLKSILKEKELKEAKYNEIQEEVKHLKKLLRDKERKITEKDQFIQNQLLLNKKEKDKDKEKSSISLEKIDIPAFTDFTNKNNISNGSRQSKSGNENADNLTEDDNIENIDINLQDDYFDNNINNNDNVHSDKDNFTKSNSPKIKVLKKDEPKLTIENTEKTEKSENKEVNKYTRSSLIKFKKENNKYTENHTLKTQLDEEKNIITQTQILTEFIVPTVENIFLNNKMNSNNNNSKNNNKKPSEIGRILHNRLAQSHNSRNTSKSRSPKRDIKNDIDVNSDFKFNKEEVNKISNVVFIDSSEKLHNKVERSPAINANINKKQKKTSSVDNNDRYKLQNLNIQLPQQRNNNNYNNNNNNNIPITRNKIKRLSEVRESLNVPKQRDKDKDKDKEKSRSKSHKKSKIREYDKIIETQLNELYAKKAKDLGNKMKKNFNINSKKPSVKNITSTPVNQNTQNTPNNHVNSNTPSTPNTEKNKEKETKSNLVNYGYVNENNRSSDKTLVLQYNKSISGLNNEESFNTELDIINFMNPEKANSNNKIAKREVTPTKKTNQVENKNSNIYPEKNVNINTNNTNNVNNVYTNNNPKQELNNKNIKIFQDKNINPFIKQDNTNNGTTKISSVTPKSEYTKVNQKEINKYVNLIQRSNLHKAGLSSKAITNVNAKNVNKFINMNNPNNLNNPNNINNLYFKKDQLNTNTQESNELKKTRDASPNLLSIARNEAKLQKKNVISDFNKHTLASEFINDYNSFGSNSNKNSVEKKKEESKFVKQFKIRTSSVENTSFNPSSYLFKKKSDKEIKDGVSPRGKLDNKSNKKSEKDNSYLENEDINEIAKNFLKEKMINLTNKITKESGGYGNKNIINVQINSLNNNINVVQKSNDSIKDDI